MHKPSILWPPPSDTESDGIRRSIRSRLRRVAGLNEQGRLKNFLSLRGRPPAPKDEPITPEQGTDAGRPVEGQDRGVVLEVAGEEPIRVDTQIQLYAPNNLISHPLISHCGAHLGGLPPLYFIAGDQEVLRDEIIYT